MQKPIISKNRVADLGGVKLDSDPTAKKKKKTDPDPTIEKHPGLILWVVLKSHRVINQL